MESNNSKRNFGIGSILFGGAIMLMALGVLPMDKQYLHAPEWIFGMCGFAFVLAGFAIVFHDNRRLVSVVAAFIFVVFSVVCAWIFLREDRSLFSDVTFGFNSLLFLILAFFCLKKAR